MSLIGDIPVVGVGAGFFEPVQKDTTWLKCFTHSANPTSAYTQNNLVFEIPKLYSDWFLFYNRMRVKLTVKLVDSEGNPPAINQSVAPINAFPQTMFSSVKLFLNETLVSGASDGLYPYYAYCSMLLNNSVERKNGPLQLNGYYEDSTPDWDYTDNTMAYVNAGSARRRNLFGATVTRTVRIPAAGEVAAYDVFQERFIYDTTEKTFYHDVFTDFKYTDTPMVSMVGARLEMTLHDPGFYLSCNHANIADCKAKKYRLDITGAELLVPARQMAPSLLVNLEKRLQQKPAEYHLNRMDMRKIALAKDQQSFSFDDIKQVNICPDRITFFIVESSRVDGKYGATPFRACNFVAPPQQDENFNDADRVYLTDMRLLLNNESLEHTQRSYTQESLPKQKYLDTLENLGYINGDAGLNIGLKDFAEGKFFCTYDLTRSRLASETGAVRQDTLQGNLRLSIKFSEALKTSAFLFVMAEYHTKVAVDKNRNVVYNYLN